MSSSRPTPPSPWPARALAFAALWWLFDLAVLRAGVPDMLDDTWEYGVAARTLLAGHGFRTWVIHPPLWGLRDAALTVPLLIHGPLIPALLAPPLALFGAPALDHIAAFNALVAVAAVVPLVRLGERCGGGAVGFAAALLWTVSPLTIHAVHHDASMILSAALLLAALDLAARPGPRPLAAGFAVGLAALTRPEMALAIPAVALATRRGRRLVVAASLACLVPEWIRSTRVVGMPFFNLSSYLALGFWAPRDGLRALRDFELTPDRFPAAVFAAWSSLAAKWWWFFPHALKRALLAPTAATGWLAPIGAAFALTSPRDRRLALLGVVLALVPVGVMTAAYYDARFLVPFLALSCLGAARAACELAARMPPWARRPRAWIGMLALVLAPTVAPALRDEWSGARSLEARLTAERRRLAAPAIAGRIRVAGAPDRASGEPGRPAYSDLPDFVAWTLDRPVIWVTSEEYGRLPALPDGSGRPVRGDASETFFHMGEPATLR